MAALPSADPTRPGAAGPGRRRRRRTDICHDRRVTTALVYLVFMLLVAAVVFLLAAMVFGRGEELAPLPPGASPTRLPAKDLVGSDLSKVRFQLVLRGYKMSEVDWVMHRAGNEIDELRARIAELERRCAEAGLAEHAETDGVPAAEPGNARDIAGGEERS